MGFRVEGLGVGVERLRCAVQGLGVGAVFVETPGGGGVEIELEAAGCGFQCSGRRP